MRSDGIKLAQYARGVIGATYITDITHQRARNRCGSLTECPPDGIPMKSI
jgi:hypothetical protein